ncbi:hypothetical protein G4B88_001364 [Cannabis sativa]|uniref:peptidylprolyl isomerase n=1 Tax=Cannabis sativa TaxID=3483 RepID=A0A7J6GB79_CANSA|nr:hypothetical protein G4B88_001364 [Cannabis sativa]
MRLTKPTSHSFFQFVKTFTSFALAIRNASSPHKALSLYSDMHQKSVPFDSFSILFTLKSCTRLHNVVLNKHLHAHIIKLGFSSHVYVATSLLYAYIVTSFDDACKLFNEMPVRNTTTWNTMITGYSRLGDVKKACSVFGEMPERDLVSWSAVIAAHINRGCNEQGLHLFRDMLMNKEGLIPDQVTVGSVLSGCAHMGTLGSLLGKSVHGFIAKNAWELNVELGTVLVDMYAKCGVITSACQVFELMRERNVMSWTALICGAAQHGYCKDALSMFELMQKEGVKANELTFTGILSACVHAGLVEEGQRFFKMIEECGLELKIQHYGCMVDLFGKAGLVEEAYEVIMTMKLQPNVVVWSSFLSACKEHKKFEMAERVTEKVLGIVKPENDGGVYTLICDLYALGGKWDDAERVRKLMVNLNMTSLASSVAVVGTCNPKRLRHCSGPSRSLPTSQSVTKLKISSHCHEDSSLRLLVDEKPKPSLFARREILGFFGLCSGLLSALTELHPSANAAEVSSCDFTVAPSGLAFCDKVVGYGPEASKGQLIKAHYVGKLENGKVFDSSYNRGKPLTFRIGVGEVIKGWDQGILGGDGVPPMLAGGKRVLKLPPELGYGVRGAGCRGGSCIIPPDSVLMFDVEFIGKAS